MERVNYIGAYDTNIFILEPDKFNMGIPRCILRDAKMQKLAVPLDALPSIPRVSKLLYDYGYGMAVVSGFVLGNGQRLQFPLNHWGEEWDRWEE